MPLCVLQIDFIKTSETKTLKKLPSKNPFKAGIQSSSIILTLLAGREMQATHRAEQMQKTKTLLCNLIVYPPRFRIRNTM